MKLVYETWPCKVDAEGNVTQCSAEESEFDGVYSRDVSVEPATAQCIADVYIPNLANLIVKLLNAAEQIVIEADPTDGNVQAKAITITITP